jgi:hypothetical protein
MGSTTTVARPRAALAVLNAAMGALDNVVWRFAQP